MEKVIQKEWKDWKKGYGELTNLYKQFLRLCDVSLGDLGQQNDSEDVHFLRKAMIRCGTDLNPKGGR